MTKTSSQKGSGRQPRHGPTRGLDDHLYGRIGTGLAPQLSPSTWLVAEWAPHQSAAGVQPGAGENLDLWGVASPRWHRTHPVCCLTQLNELY